MRFKPNLPYNITCQWLIPSVVKVNGVNTISYSDGPLFGCSMKSWGGREQTINDVYHVIEQWNVETYYDPNITKNYRVKILQDDSEWMLMTAPENVEMANKYMVFKMERVV